VILPSWHGYISAQPDLCDGLLPWFRELSSSAVSFPDFVRSRRYGLSPDCRAHTHRAKITSC
jgi:hypothetical protein